MSTRGETTWKDECSVLRTAQTGPEAREFNGRNVLGAVAYVGHEGA